MVILVKKKIKKKKFVFQKKIFKNGNFTTTGQNFWRNAFLVILRNFTVILRNFTVNLPVILLKITRNYVNLRKLTTNSHKFHHCINKYKI